MQPKQTPGHFFTFFFKHVIASILYGVEQNDFHLVTFALPSTDVVEVPLYKKKKKAVP
jgi:hypothetical protein